MPAQIRTCSKRDTTCYDCTDRECLHAGDKGADCPQYHCVNDRPGDCEHCSYIDGYIRIMRRQYRKHA